MGRWLRFVGGYVNHPNHQISFIWCFLIHMQIMSLLCCDVLLEFFLSFLSCGCFLLIHMKIMSLCCDDFLEFVFGVLVSSTGFWMNTSYSVMYVTNIAKKNCSNADMERAR